MRRLFEKVRDFIAARAWFDYAFLGTLGFLVLFLFLWSQGLWDPWESNAAEAAREAAEEGRWFPLAYDGKPMPALPPLFFWIQALWMKVAGTGDLAVRLPAAVSALLWLLFVYGAVKRLAGRKTAFLLALSILTSPFFYGNARHSSPHLFATMLAFAALLSTARLLLSEKKVPGRAGGLLPWIFLSATFLSGGLQYLLFVLLALGAALLAGVLGGFPLPQLRRLAGLPGLLTFIVTGGAWIAAGLVSSGGAFQAGFLDLQALSFGSMRAFGRSEVFTWHILQAGHMLYPWFVLFPAGAMWLALLETEGRRGAHDHFLLALFLGGPAALLFLDSFLPSYLPIDMIAVCPSLALVGAWGLVRASENEQVAGNRILLSLGALLIGLGCASLGVDYFWALKRPVEMMGYAFNRTYPDLSAIVKFFYNGVALVAGASTATLLILKRKASFIAWALGLAAIVATFFIIHHVARVCGGNFSARPLMDSYASAAQEGDLLATYLMEPESSGGELYYFKRKAEPLEDLADLKKFLESAAGRGRAVLITSHVRDLYNQVFAVSCGVRIKPLNENRKWYAISGYEGPPPTDPGRVVLKDIGEARIETAMDLKFLWQGKHYFTLIGYTLGNLIAKTRTVKRGSWIDVELFWRSEEKLPESWKIYLDAIALQKGKIYSHVSMNHVPACGTYPTADWSKGEIVRDFARLYFASSLSPGPYQIRTGIFSSKNDRMSAEEPASGSGKAGAAKTTLTLETIRVE